MKQVVYVGTYTQGRPGEKERREGIYVYEFDTTTGGLALRSTAESSNPSFLAFGPGGRCLYAANELRESQASAFAVDPASGALTPLNRQPTQGMHSCYASLDPSGGWLLTANYSSGNVSVLPVSAGGSLGALTDLAQHEGKGPNAARQERTHAHSVRFDPSGQFALAADLGIDRVMIYRLDRQAGKLHLHGWGQSAPGAGPRHMEWHPGAKVLYVANELDSTVSIYDWDAAQGSLTHRQALTLLPEGYEQAAENTAADIHLTPDVRYLYVSNRGHNSLAAFAVGEDGSLTPAGIYPCGGNWPRNFAIAPGGQYLLAANQYSQNLAVFAIAADGSLVPNGVEVAVPAPVCVIFAA